MSLFRDSERQDDRSIIRGLQRYHSEILRATGGRLNAELVEDGTFPSSGGRPKKRWALVVRPSQSLFERPRTLIEIGRARSSKVEGRSLWPAPSHSTTAATGFLAVSQTSRTSLPAAVAPKG